MSNNDTEVNVKIGATDTSKGVIDGAMAGFGNLWKQIAAGQAAFALAEEGAKVLIGAIGYSIKSAGDFQASLVRLTTSAGESKSNLGIVGDGIKSIAISTGSDIKQLTDAMYVIESGGQHGAAGLQVLKAAAQGAKTENAELKTVADAVTSVLQDYHLKASASADVTSKLVAAVGTGKTTFQELAGSLHSVLPIASSAGISLSDITGAIASMTVHGMSADQAAQNLSDTIKHMVAPTQVQTKELGQLGMSSSELAGMLGKKGITGTLQDLSEVILKHMGPSGKVMLDSFNQSKDAANDANIMLSKLPASAQAIAKEFQNGKISLGDYRKALKDLPADQANLVQQFASTENRAKGFNDLLKSGQPAAQTYQDALRRVTGDATGLNVALMLTGENTKYVNNAVSTISKTTTEAGGSVKGWSEIQQTFNFRIAQFKAVMQVAAIDVGTALINLIMWFGKMWDAMQPVVRFVVNLFKPALDQLKKALEDQMKAFEPIWKVIKGPVMDALIALAALIFGPMLLALAAFGVAAYVFIKVATWITELVTWFYKLGTAIVSAIDHPKTLLAQIGHDLIAGLIDGMTGQFGKVLDHVKSLGNEVVKGLKGVLGIHSPSTVFADIGQNMGKGLIQGLQGIQAKANVAVTGLVTGSNIVSSNGGSAQTPVSNTTNNYTSSGGNRASVTIGQVVLASDSAVTEFFKHIDRDTQLQSMGLSPARGIS